MPNDNETMGDTSETTDSELSEADLADDTGESVEASDEDNEDKVHADADYAVAVATDTLLTEVKRAVTMCMARGIKCGATDLATLISKKYSLPIGFCQSVVSLWFDNHLTYESKKGPQGGIVYRTPAKTEEEKKAAAKNKVTRALPSIPGLSD